MATKLKDLVVKEVSLVDRPANPGARILLAKRADVEKGMYGVSRFADLLGSIGYLYSDAKNEAEYEGDNSPIPSALRTWLVDGGRIFQGMAQEELAELTAELKKREFSAAQRRAAASSGAAMSDGSFPIENKSDLKNAIQAYGRAKDKAKAKAHIISRARALGATSMLPDGWVSKQADDGPEGEMAMSDAAEIQKKLDDAVAALAKANGELALLRMPEAHRAYMDDAGMNETAKAAFLAKSEAEREAFIKVNPVEMKLPASVVKALELAKADREALEKLREKDEIETFAKRAEELGCSREFGETLRKARAGNGEEFAKLEQQLKALNEQVRTGKVFAEFGSTGGHVASAYDALVAKRDELRKSQPQLTPEQAFAKVYGDPANRKLVADYKREMGRPS